MTRDAFQFLTGLAGAVLAVMGALMMLPTPEGAAAEAAAGYAALVRRDARALSDVRDRAQAADRFFREVPEMDEDVHDLDGLDLVARFVFDGG